MWLGRWAQKAAAGEGPGAGPRGAKAQVPASALTPGFAPVNDYSGLQESRGEGGPPPSSLTTGCT